MSHVTVERNKIEANSRKSYPFFSFFEWDTVGDGKGTIRELLISDTLDASGKRQNLAT